MAKAVTINHRDSSNTQVYYSTLGETYWLPEMYELEAPFYALVGGDKKYFSVDVGYDEPVNQEAIEIIAAFKRKEDLINWMRMPLIQSLQ